jgi:dipeptidase D
MDNNILNLQPKIFWKYFLEISKIPRGSKHEGKIIDYTVCVAKKLKLEFKKDETGNIAVKKPASKGYENSPVVILQSHLDMVNEKETNSKHDFSKDPLKLILNGNILKAEGTTLGADNGVGVALQLALMEDNSLVHGPLELLFTVDEETGMTGANNLKPGFITGKYLINLDSEDLGTYCIGCAGGVDTTGKLKLSKVKSKINDSIAVKIEIENLTGGHSGVDIAKGRANAIKLMGRILFNLNKNFHPELVAVYGGSRRNVIPREAYAELLITKNDMQSIEKSINKTANEIAFEYRRSDPNLSIKLSQKNDAPDTVIESHTAANIIDILNSIPNGVFAMSQDIEGFPATSSNFAVLKVEDDILTAESLQRSESNTAKAAAANSIISSLTLGGFSAESSNGYPGWTPVADSELLKICKNANLEYLKKPAVVEVIHAGLECGLIGSVFTGMEMVSMGATIKNVHTPDEQLFVDTVNDFWNILLLILKKIINS